MQGHCSYVGCHNIGYYRVVEKFPRSRYDYLCALHLPGQKDEHEVDNKVTLRGVTFDEIIQEALDLGVLAGDFVMNEDGTYSLAEEAND